MNLVAYTTCPIQFIPSNKRDPRLDYSERILIELRQGDSRNYFLRAVDIQNPKEV